jgi:hypothetical protein
MASNASAPATVPGPAEKDLIPPDERFWVRYSPHHEFPLANVTSFVAHVLAFGLILVLAAWIGTGRNHQVPVEAVRLGLTNPGGGGKKHGTGDGPGGAAPQVEAAANQENPSPEPADDRRRPDLEAVRSPEFTQNLDPDAKRFFDRPNPTPSMGAFARLNENVRASFRPGPAPKGRGGSGSGGGQGDGTGTGTGSGSGEGTGRGNLTQREKRMLRWTMLFNTNNGPDYLRQLHGLGAILAIPVKENPEPEYQIVRDLTRTPAQLISEDVTKIQRIYWVDNKAESVRDVMAALGLSIRPSHFVAFMTPQIEDKLFELERKHARGRPEDQINETRFRVRQLGGRYEPEFESISFK